MSLCCGKRQCNRRIVLYTANVLAARIVLDLQKRNSHGKHGFTIPTRDLSWPRNNELGVDSSRNCKQKLDIETTAKLISRTKRAIHVDVPTATRAHHTTPTSPYAPQVHPHTLSAAFAASRGAFGYGDDLCDLTGADALAIDLHVNVLEEDSPDIVVVTVVSNDALNNGFGADLRGEGVKHGAAEVVHDDVAQFRSEKLCRDEFVQRFLQVLSEQRQAVVLEGAGHRAENFAGGGGGGESVRGWMRGEVSDG
ncbi:unnamed protein product [Chondrus crispus]|uniref:Uncharacterized protein n=1 Tax=Chondrus crispus TaxID=2769 RepID=R7QTY5_CHOCR|nr:unnamed protein product [Chondrus crispus]CDF41173.1 unnamed protein product [Chondrus crispus]|eukprot:XP_005711467.1 unnamed protein product [Chondrus crispus]